MQKYSSRKISGFSFQNLIRFNSNLVNSKFMDLDHFRFPNNIPSSPNNRSCIPTIRRCKSTIALPFIPNIVGENIVLFRIIPLIRTICRIIRTIHRSRSPYNPTSNQKYGLNPACAAASDTTLPPLFRTNQT